MKLCPLRSTFMHLILYHFFGTCGMTIAADHMKSAEQMLYYVANSHSLRATKELFHRVDVSFQQTAFLSEPEELGRMPGLHNWVEMDSMCRVYQVTVNTLLLLSKACQLLIKRR
jgi:hypothetical protein